MDEKSNEELLDELIRRARLSVGKLTKGEACAGEYAAVLARMAGPGEVVVPREPTDKMIDAAIKTAEHVADRDGEMYPLYSVSEVYAVMLAARPNNGGTDDQGK